MKRLKKQMNVHDGVEFLEFREGENSKAIRLKDNDYSQILLDKAY
jgi:streptomycin 6-kinase